MKKNFVESSSFSSRLIPIKQSIIKSNNLKMTSSDSGKLIHGQISRKFSQKTNSFIKLIRPNNIIPTLALSFSGGFIMNNSLYKLFKSPQFIVSIINTLLIMSSSMIINDIIDINIDRINNPSRPLVKGTISLKEAKIYVLLLLSITEILSFNFLPNELQLMVNLAILNISIYTSFLKKIPLIKNLSCAFLVSFTSIFSGMASADYIFFNKNFNLLLITSYLIFTGSLCNELLLDMSDITGDRLNRINTIPVLYGNNFSLNLVKYILRINIIFSTVLISNLYGIKVGIPLLIILLPLINNLKNIRKYNYSKNIIINVVKNTEKPLFISLLYLVSISFLY
jgi:geranylgeranylglycerol-phosphate geranylgeranyltransferase